MKAINHTIILILLISQSVLAQNSSVKKGLSIGTSYCAGSLNFLQVRNDLNEINYLYRVNMYDGYNVDLKAHFNNLSVHSGIGLWQGSYLLKAKSEGLVLPETSFSVSTKYISIPIGIQKNFYTRKKGYTYLNLGYRFNLLNRLRIESDMLSDSGEGLIAKTDVRSSNNFFYLGFGRHISMGVFNIDIEPMLQYATHSDVHLTGINYYQLYYGARFAVSFDIPGYAIKRWCNSLISTPAEEIKPPDLNFLNDTKK